MKSSITTRNGNLLLKRPDLLMNLNTITANYQSLLSEMSLFNRILSIPSVLPQKDPSFYPRVLLRTKLPPGVYEPPPSNSSDNFEKFNEIIQEFEEIAGDLHLELCKSEKMNTSEPESNMNLLNELLCKISNGF
jgi:hypothetical protein